MSSTNLNRRYDTVFEFHKKATLQTAILWEICHVLKHNFFNDIAAMLPADFATEVPADTSQAEKIAELQKRSL